MKITNTFYAHDVAEWRAWLEQNYQTESEVWLIFYKAHTGQPCISYEESLDEALCYGWIDSIIQKIDEEKYARKYTPRKNTARWSEVNKRKVARLIREGRMTDVGLSKIDDLSTFSEEAPEPKSKEPEVPSYLEQALKQSPLAWDNFCKMAPSYRRVYIGWITSAKREETLNKRLKEAIELLEQNRPLGMK